jgi:hypothetical protein
VSLSYPESPHFFETSRPPLSEYPLSTKPVIPDGISYLAPQGTTTPSNHSYGGKH